MAEWFGTKCFVVPSSQRLGTCPGDCPGDSCRLGWTSVGRRTLSNG